MNDRLRMAGWMAILVIAAAAGHAQERHFSGFHAGVDLGSQSIIGGSLVGGVDVLAQDDRVVTSLTAGYRYEFPMGLVVGVEGSYGMLDGDLTYSDPFRNLEITYESDDQTTLGATLGWSFGVERNWLGFAYLSEATREFDVTIRIDGSTFLQQDEQGMLRYGLGIEKQINRGLHLRLAVGSGRADFDGETNIDPDEELEYSAGILWQF